MKSISRLDEWPFKHLEHGMDGKTKLPPQRTLIATNDNDFALALLLDLCKIRGLDRTDS